eukprot:NODE_224_length_1172_cov_402.045414_g187_i0.p4 GENE.NODE_224_length_1172_cov_402.045414_g187_i0~~NODE_224_length_1172_cov_402.045414_g187_i0.p4  ORF type:complete len:70 (+),score=2.53 NODE_224_length_1172_cov_402.045414_g187_i0:628-837(+)
MLHPWFMPKWSWSCSLRCTPFSFADRFLRLVLRYAGLGCNRLALLTLSLALNCSILALTVDGVLSSCLV